MLSWRGFIARRRLRLRLRRWLRLRPLLLPPHAEMALERWEEIRLIPGFAIAVAFQSCGVDLRLRDVIGRVHVLRMLSQPFFNVRRHRGRLRLLLLRRFRCPSG